MMPAASASHRQIVLVLDTAFGACRVALCQGGQMLAHADDAQPRGHAALLPGLVEQVMGQASWPHVDKVAAIRGPGSFTGLRTGLAFAQGLAAGWACEIAGVDAGDALRRQAAGQNAAAVWVAIHARSGHIFLQLSATSGWSSRALDALPPAPRGLLIAGNAEAETLAALSPLARGMARALGQQACACAIAACALDQPGPARPLYVDPPQARPSA